MTILIENQDSINKREILDKIAKELKKVRSYRPKVGIFGDTGVGKSSLCNALFGKETAKISNVEACTREPQHILIGGSNNHGITLIDVPGVGEDPERHQEYIQLYQSLLPELDLILWVIKADDRKYLSAIDVYTNILKPNLDNCPVVFVINQVDKIEPIEEWYENNKKLGPTQQNNLIIKTNDISSRFDVSTNKIIPVSAKGNYNLVELVNRVVEVLPNEKKYAFTRETKEENVSEEATRNAEKGIFDHIKEAVGNAWDYVKDDVVDYLVEKAKEHIPKVAKKVISLFSSWF
jgi:hypothetical protein